MTSIAALLPAPLMVESPDVVGPLAVFPIITSREASVPFLSFSRACARGTTINELGGGASVNDVFVKNPLDELVLLYEGEEVLGAQQNRTFDQSVLVCAQGAVRVPVSCVEAGRWDGRRHGEAFRPAPQTAYPELRRRKNEALRARVAAGLEARAEQGEVWDEVAAKASRMSAQSATGAMHDVFESRRTQVEAMRSGISDYCSQIGALVAIGGRFVVLDLVANVDAFQSLHGPLLSGYALDALESDDPRPAPSLEDARDFVETMLRAEPTPAPTAGLGEGLTFRFGTLAGTGLTYESELVTLSAFAS